MPDISVFESIKQVDSPDNIPLQVYLDGVREGQWQDMVLTIRSIKDKERRNLLKRELPGVTFSGIFSYRKDDSLLEHSGYICMDLDDVEDPESVKELLKTDKYVYSCFTSTSGNGLRVLFRINGAKHREAYLGISSYLLRHYDLIADPQCINPSRSFYVTFDPHIYVNDRLPPVFTEYPKEKQIKKITNEFVFAEDDFANIMKQVEQRSLNLCEEYQDWLKIGFALAHKFGENGRGYFHTLSSFSSKYNIQRTDKQYTYCVRSSNSSIATISTFYYYCKAAGLQVTSERTQKVRKATITGKAAGLTKQQILVNLEKNEGITQADTLVEDVYNSAADISSDSLVEQLELFVANNYNLRRNEITKYIERDGTPLTQKDLNSIFIAAKKVINKIDYNLLDRLLLSDFIPSYNPLIEFFKNLGEWDAPDIDPFHIELHPEKTFESPLIDKLADTIKNDNPGFTAYFLRKWLVSIVSAAHKVHSPLVFVLVGKQSTGKTEWFRRLIPKDIKDYYAESKLDAGKDDDILMTQKLIIMDDELSGKSKKQVDRLKELTSKQWFSLREPYGRNNVDILRIAVLCGTSNFKEVLSDPTGNRRIIPIMVHDIDKKLYNSIDKKELFREAYNLYREGFDWRVVSKKDIEYLGVNEEDYTILSSESEFILKFYRPSLVEKADLLSTSEIKSEIETITQQRLSLAMLGRQMHKLGFEQKSVRVSGTAMKKWMVVKINRVNQPFQTPEGVNPF